MFLDEPKVDITRLAIRLFDGSRVQRNFKQSDTIQHVMDFVDTKITEPIENYVLSTNYPKQPINQSYAPNYTQEGQGYQIAPAGYQYLPLHNGENTSINGGNYYPAYQGQYVAPPPGYYGQASAVEVVVEEKKCNRSYFHAEDITGALIIFILGFFLSCNSTARALGILSVVFFLIFAILVATIIVIAVTVGVRNPQDWSSDSSSSSYYY
eukprot:gene18867-22567_t